MKYLRTKLATDWEIEEPSSRHIKILEKIFFFIPEANPGYKYKYHLINEWLVEFIDDEPWREIALNENEEPVFAGPDKKNYGFWHDTNMKFMDFEGELIDKDIFESKWKESGVIELK